MMKVYLVEVERLSSDWGCFQGWKTVGYYSTIEKAETAKAEWENKSIIYGKAKITEIEIQ